MTVLYTVVVPIDGQLTPIELTKTGRLRFADGIPNRAIHAYQALTGGTPDARTAMVLRWERNRRATVATLLAQHLFPRTPLYLSFTNRLGVCSAFGALSRDPFAPDPTFTLVLSHDWWRTVYLAGIAISGDALCLGRSGPYYRFAHPALRDGSAFCEQYWADADGGNAWGHAPAFASAHDLSSS